MFEEQVLVEHAHKHFLVEKSPRLSMGQLFNTDLKAWVRENLMKFHWKGQFSSTHFARSLNLGTSICRIR